MTESFPSSQLKAKMVLAYLKHENIRVPHLQASCTLGNWYEGISICSNCLCPSGYSSPHMSWGWQGAAALNVSSGNSRCWCCRPQPPLAWQPLCGTWESAKIWVLALSETSFRASGACLWGNRISSRWCGVSVSGLNKFSIHEAKPSSNLYLLSQSN